MLISIDGIDGCGKSTQQRRLAEAIGAETLTEISPSRWGKTLRAMEAPTLAQQLALFTADRAGLVPRLERAAGSRADHLVSDRSYLSSVAYQSYDAPLTPDFLEEMMRTLVPEYDLMLVLDLPVETALTRVNARGQERDWCETPERLTWARDVFRTWSEKRENIVVINGDQALDAVSAAIVNAAEARAETRFGALPW